MLEHLVQLPAAYDADPARRWPLLVFLHGAAERGGTLAVVRDMPHSIPRVAATAPDFPFVAVSPHCPGGAWWTQQVDAIGEVIDAVMASHRVDPDRVYLTGISMGGMGTWAVAERWPDRFAAIAPVCGGTDPSRVAALRRLPVWSFHGALDEVVPIGPHQRAVDALRAAGGDVRFTVYPDVHHDAWARAYADPELYAWLLAHRRRGR